MIKVKKIIPQVVECFDNENKFLGSLNEYEFLDLRVKIALNKISGYYVMFDGGKVIIEPNGKIKDWPSKMFTTMECLWAELFKAQRS